MTDSKTNILVTGGNGQLGREIFNISIENPSLKFFIYDKSTLDIQNTDLIRSIIIKENIEFCINCAAYTAVDKAEEEIELAFAINSLGVKTLAEVCADQNVVLIHISSDYVYDNGLERPLLESDPVFPKGVYGKSKLAGEQHIWESGTKAIVIRTSWVYSTHGNNFVKTMLRLTKDKDALSVVNDQIGSPTFARDLARVIVKMIITVRLNEDESLFSTYNFSNVGFTNWFEFAKIIASKAGNQCAISPVSTSEFNAKAPRPLYSVLNTKKIQQLFNITDIPHWKDSLNICMLELNN